MYFHYLRLFIKDTKGGIKTSKIKKQDLEMISSSYLTAGSEEGK